jgi:hypothetical protein
MLAKVFHPLFLFFYFFVLVLLVEPGAPTGLEAWKLVGMAFLFTVGFPLAFMLMFRKDFLLNHPKQRRGPLLFVLICNLALLILLPTHKVAPAYTLLIANSLGLLGLYLINFFFKISIHAAGITTFLIFLSFYLYDIVPHREMFFALVLVFIGLLFLVLRQRYVSGSHSLSQILAGMALGAAAGALVMVM